jgi:hypothetical protein
VLRSPLPLEARTQGIDDGDQISREILALVFGQIDDLDVSSLVF